jgi:hypothetical protein
MAFLSRALQERLEVAGQPAVDGAEGTPFAIDCFESATASAAKGMSA